MTDVIRARTLEQRHCHVQPEIPPTMSRCFQAALVMVTGHLDRVKRIWYLSPMRAAKVQTSLRIRAVSPEPSLLAHTSSESRGTFRQKARSLVPLNGWACAVKVCHDGMLEDINSLDGAHLLSLYCMIDLMIVAGASTLFSTEFTGF